jgi:hypothetical protein
VINPTAKIIAAHENRMLLHFTIMVSVKVQLTTENKPETKKERVQYKHLIKAKVVHASRRHVSNPKLNDTAAVFTNVSHVLRIAKPGFFQA